MAQQSTALQANEGVDSVVVRLDARMASSGTGMCRLEQRKHYPHPG